MNKEQLTQFQKNIETKQKASDQQQNESPQSYLDEEIQKQLKEQFKSNNSVLSQNYSNMGNSQINQKNQQLNEKVNKNNSSKYSSSIINNNSNININLKNLKEKKNINNNKKKGGISLSQNSPKQQVNLSDNNDINNDSDSVSEQGKLVEQIFELFFALRTNLDEDTSLSVRNKIPLDETVEEVCEMDPFTVFYYIRVIIDATFKLKEELQEMMEKQAENDISEYESQLQKAEAEIRNHISVEQQLKLYYENQQQKLEESEAEKGKEIEQLKLKLEGFELNQKKINESMKDLEQRLQEKENKIKEVQSELQKKNDIIQEHDKKNKQYIQQIKDLEQNIQNQKSSFQNQQQQINQINQRNNTISQQQLYRKQLVKGQDIMYDPQEIIQKKLMETQKNKYQQLQQQQQTVSQQSHYQNLDNNNANNSINKFGNGNREVLGMKNKNTSKSSQNLKNNANQSINKYKQLKGNYQYNLEDENGLYQYLQEKMITNNKGSKNNEDLFNKVKKLQNALEKKLQPQTHRGDIVHTEGNDRTERIRGQSINHIGNTSNTHVHNQSTKRGIKRGGSSYNLNRTHQIYSNTSFSQKQNSLQQRGHLQQSSKLIKERSKTINTSKFNDTTSNLNTIQAGYKKSKNALYNEKSPNRSFSKTHRNNSHQQNINSNVLNNNTINVLQHNNSHLANNNMNNNANNMSQNLGKTQSIIKDHLLTIDNSNKQNRKSVEKLKAFMHPSPYSQNNQNISKKSKKKSQNLSYQQ